MEIDASHLAERIKSAVDAKKVTQTKLAEAVSLDPAQLSRFIKTGGGVSSPQLQALGRALDELSTSDKPLPPAFAVEVARLLRDRKLVLFVGAGLSLQCPPIKPRTDGLPSWRGLMDAVAAQFDPDEVSTDGFDDLPLFFDHVQAIPGGEAKIQLALRDALNIADIALSPSHALLAEMPWREVWTTNYENLLERAFAAESVNGETQFGLIDTYQRKQRPFILHLHGTVEDPHTLGAKSYDEWQTSNEKVMAHVRSVLMTSSALFIGYGMGDPHFKATLAWVRKVTKNDVRMFALMHKTAAGVLKAQASVNNLHAVSMDSNTAYVNSLSQIKLEWLKLAGNISKSAGDVALIERVEASRSVYERGRLATALHALWNDTGVGRLWNTDRKYAADVIAVSDIFVEPSVALAADAERVQISRSEAETVEHAIRQAPQRGRPGIAELRAQADKAEGETRPHAQQSRPALATIAQQRLVVLLGDPGSGKSLLLRQAALLAVDAWREQKGPLPFYFRLNQWESRSAVGEPAGMLLNALRDGFLAGGEVSGEQVREWMSGGQGVLWLLDGLDEVRDASERMRLRDGLQALTRMRPNDRFVVSARPSGYTARLDGQWQEFSLQRLSDTQARAVLEKWRPIVKKNDRVDLPVQQLEADLRHSAALKNLRRNPLILTLAIMFYRYQRRLPKDRWDFYEQVDKSLRDDLAVDRVRAGDPMLGLRDDWKALLGQIALAGFLDTEDNTVRFSRAWLEHEAVSFYRSRQYSFESAHAQAQQFLDAADALLGVIIAFAPEEYGFLHLTFQEYHAASRLLAQSAADRAPIMATHWDNPDWAEVWNLFVLGAHSRGTAEPIAQLMQSARDNTAPDTDPHLARVELAVLGWAGLCGAGGQTGTVWKEVEAWVPSQLPGGFWQGAICDHLAQWGHRFPPALQSALLKTLLDDAAPGNVRGSAAGALSAVATEAEVQSALLKTLLDDKTPIFVRGHAADALSVVATEAAVQSALLKTLLDDKAPEDARGSATTALSAVAMEPTVQSALLKTLLDDEAPVSLRGGAARALGAVATESVVQSALLKILLDDKPHEMARGSAVQALRVVAAESAVQSALLTTLLDDKAPDVARGSAAQALGAVATNPAVKSALLKTLLDSNALGRVRMGATQALSAVAAESAVQSALVNTLLDDTAPEMARGSAAATLRAVATEPNVQSALRKTLLDDNAPDWVRVNAVESLRGVAAEPAVQSALLIALLDDTAPEWAGRRWHAAGALCSVATVSAVQTALVKTLLDDKAPSPARWFAVQGLSAVATDAAVQSALLITLLDDKAPEDLRGKAAYALSAVAAEPTVQSALLNTLLDAKTSDWGRRSAARALGAVATEPTVQSALLKSLLDDKAPEDLRTSAAQALSAVARTVRLRR